MRSVQHGFTGTNYKGSAVEEDEDREERRIVIRNNSVSRVSEVSGVNIQLETVLTALSEGRLRQQNVWLERFLGFLGPIKNPVPRL